MIGPLPGHCYWSFSHAVALYRHLYNKTLNQLHQSADSLLSKDSEDLSKIVFIVIVFGGMRLQIVNSCASLCSVCLWMYIYLKLHYNVFLTLTLTQITVGSHSIFGVDMRFVKTLAAASYKRLY